MLNKIATLGPIGSLPAPGTCATLATLPFAYFLYIYTSLSIQCAVLLIVFFGGLFAIGKAMPSFGNQSDPAPIVIDEVVGTLFTFACVPMNFKTLILGFILFRVFDIFKVGLIKKMEELPGAWGIMMDDVVAGVLANVVLQMVWVFLI